MSLIDKDFVEGTPKEGAPAAPSFEAIYESCGFGAEEEAEEAETEEEEKDGEAA